MTAAKEKFYATIAAKKAAKRTLDGLEHTMHNPVNLAFNAAVLTLANKVCPCGYDVSDDAPKTLDGLLDHIARTGRIVVSKHASDQTIYGDREVNWAFRAWHDWTHYILRAPFTLDGELAVAHRQIEDICRLYGHSATTREWSRLIMAEVYGQACYLRDHGDFPADQVAFDLAYVS